MNDRTSLNSFNQASTMKLFLKSKKSAKGPVALCPTSIFPRICSSHARDTHDTYDQFVTMTPSHV